MTALRYHELSARIPMKGIRGQSAVSVMEQRCLFMSEQTGRRDFPTLFTELPGPDRKRVACPYSYQLTYRNPRAEASGCRMIWQVSGGRMVYQIALEQNDAGKLC